MVRKRLKLKPKYEDILKKIGTVLVVFLVIFIFYRYQIHTIKKIGYSEKAANRILFKFKKNYVIDKENYKSLNAAFESNDYIEKNLKYYVNINYHKGDKFIKNINTLLSKKYSISDINLIMDHGNQDDVYEFSKKKKINYLEEYFSYDFAKLKYYDKYVKYSNEEGTDAYSTIVYVNLGFDNEEYKNPFIVNKFSTDMLVNKHFMLGKSFKAHNLVTIDKEYTNGEDLKVNKIVLDSFKKMYKDMSKENLLVYISDAYRSHYEQKKTYDYLRGIYGDNYVSNNIMRPYFSENETGLCLSFQSVRGGAFVSTKEHKWLLDNAYKYGFILRYPSEFSTETLLKGNAWHFRYVGKKASKYIQEHKMSYEEYYVVFIDK